MNATVDTGGEFIQPGAGKAIKLSEVALDILKLGPDGIDRFFRACGDSFVTSYRMGGRLRSILTIRNTTQGEKESISAQAKGSYGAFRAGGGIRENHRYCCVSQQVAGLL